MDDNFEGELWDRVRNEAEYDVRRIVSETFLKEVGIGYRDFQRFLRSKGLREGEVYENISGIFKEEGNSGNLRNYIKWIENGIEDLKRFDKEVVPEVKVSELVKDDSLNVGQRVSLSVLVMIGLWILANILLFFF